MASLAVTYDDLRREVGRFLGYGRDPEVWGLDTAKATDAADIINSGLRRFLNPPPLNGEKYAHEWSFLRPLATISTTAPYATGTVTAAAGIVTLADGVWPLWATQGELSVASGTYSVASRTSNSEIVLSDTSVSITVGEAFTLGQPAYDLPSDFAMFDGPLTYAVSASAMYPPIEIIPEHLVRQELSEVTSTGRPTVAAYRPKTIDQTAGTRYELVFAPIPDAAYPMHYRYRVNVSAVDATNCYPPGGEPHGETILEACLAAAEAKLNDGAGIHATLFQERLYASVSFDRKLSAPDFAGYNRDASDRPISKSNSHDCDVHIVTYNGVAY